MADGLNLFPMTVPRARGEPKASGETRAGPGSFSGAPPDNSPFPHRRE